MTDLLVLDQLSVVYRQWWSRRRVAAVQSVSLRVGAGEAVGLVGESGCGKSTLVSATVGVAPRTTGSVTLGGRPLTHRVGHRHGPRPEDVQTIFQNVDAHIDPAWTPDALLAETAARFGRDSAEVEAVLARVGLSHRRSVVAGRLSGGERRRLGLARVLLVRAQLILADEPCAGVDAGRRLDLVHALRAHQPPGGGLLLVSHDLHLVRATCDRVYVMLGGRVVEHCPTVDLGRLAHHPYTDTLLRAAGLREGDVPPHHANPGPGCALVATCSSATATCRSVPPRLLAQSSPEHRLACPHPVAAP